MVESSGRDRAAIRAAVPIGLVLVVAYSWWASGVAPFSAPADVALAIPVVLVALLSFGQPLHRPRADPLEPATWRRTWPWATLLFIALGLEVAAVALGGRSSAVPTLSTVVDHALAGHGVRFALFVTWLAFGSWPLVRAGRVRWGR